MLALVFTACSSEGIINTDEPEINSGEKAQLCISAVAPGSQNFVTSSRATVDDTEAESEVKNLNVYIFRTDNEHCYSMYRFGENHTAYTEGSNGSKNCVIEIPDDLIGETVNIAILGNRTTGLNLSANNYTQFLANAALTAVTDNTSASSSLVKDGFPMSCILENVVLKKEGVKVEATLVRTVARIDIFNNTPNLTVTGATLLNVNDKGMFFRGTGTVNIPTDATKIMMKPISAYETLLQGGIAFTPVEGGTADAIREANSNIAFYLNESEVTDLASSPIVKIDYKVGFNGADTEGSIEIPFKTAEGTYFNAVRNHLYTVQLGDGTAAGPDDLRAVVVPQDWNAIEIDDQVNPDEEKVNS